MTPATAPGWQYVALDNVFINTINFADGSRIENIMGADIFAYTGLFQYTDKALFVFGAGQEDFEPAFGQWFNANGASREGVYLYPGRTTLATMQYKPNGEWTETYQFGPKGFATGTGPMYEACVRMLGQVARQNPLKGVYVAGGMCNWPYMQALFALRRQHGFKLMLELFTRECRPDNLANIRDKMLPEVDIYSLNRTEGYALFGVDTEQAVIEQLQRLGTPCYFRAGSKGSYMVTDDTAAFVPVAHVVPAAQEVDPTGCGNCSTAAALWGFCEGYAPVQIAAIGNVAAGYNVQQYGPYPTFNAQTRNASLQLALRLAGQAAGH